MLQNGHAFLKLFPGVMCENTSKCAKANINFWQNFPWVTRENTSKCAKMDRNLSKIFLEWLVKIPQNTPKQISIFQNFPGVTPPDPRQVLGPRLNLKEPSLTKPWVRAWLVSYFGDKLPKQATCRGRQVAGTCLHWRQVAGTCLHLFEYSYKMTRDHGVKRVLPPLVECQVAECHFTECQVAKCHLTECTLAECKVVKCCLPECKLAEL
jgi:hypothetical protein